jgi:hypothetical protein
MIRQVGGGQNPRSHASFFLHMVVYYSLSESTETMGWNIRRSVNFGPLRINLSKSGLGYSVGTRGFRVGQDARGRRYRSLSIPKTGVYRRDYFSGLNAQGSGLPTISTPSQATSPSIVAKPTLGVRTITAGQWAAYLGGAVVLYLLIRAFL